MHPAKDPKNLTKVIAFLRQIGIDVAYKKLPENTFLPGLDIGANCVYIDREKLLYPGDVLHEAGHIAVTSAAERPLIGSSNMAEKWPTQGDEMAAILWSYAALTYLELPAEFVFHPFGYKKDAEWLILNFKNEQYIGLALIEWFDLAYGKERASREGVAPYPVMQRWLRE